MTSVHFRMMSMLTATICIIFLGNTTPKLDTSAGERLTEEMQVKSESAISIIKAELKQAEEILSVEKDELSFINKNGSTLILSFEDTSLAIHNTETGVSNYLDLDINDFQLDYNDTSNTLKVKVVTNIDVTYNRDKKLSYTGVSESKINL